MLQLGPIAVGGGMGWVVRTFFRRVALALALSLLLAAVTAAQADENFPKSRAGTPPTPEEVRRMLGGTTLDTPPTRRSDDAPLLGSDLGAAPVAVLPFIFEGGHIILDVAIDGGAKRPFVLDTGASDIVTPEAATALGLETHGRTRTGGIGPDRLTGSFTTADQVRIGEASIKPLPFLVLEMPNGLVDRGSRPRIDGLIGAEFFDFFAVRIDYQKHSISLFSRGAFHPSGSGFSLPLTVRIDRKAFRVVPTIAATIEGASGNFAVDTGNGGQILLIPAFMDREGLRASYPDPVRFLAPGGVGGRLRVAMALGKEVGVGTAKLTTPLVNFPEKAQDIYGTLGEAGLIGNGVLRAFIVTIDFHEQRIYFEPTGHTELTRRLFGTGLILDKPKHTAFEVIDLLSGSAAERSGLERGDSIVKIEGQAAEELALSDFGNLNSDPARKSLHVERSDGRGFDLAIAQILPK